MRGSFADEQWAADICINGSSLPNPHRAMLCGEAILPSNRQQPSALARTACVTHIRRRDTREQVGDDSVEQRQVVGQELGVVHVAQRAQQQHILALSREVALQVAGSGDHRLDGAHACTRSSSSRAGMSTALMVRMCLCLLCMCLCLLGLCLCLLGLCLCMCLCLLGSWAMITEM